jgi:hypothetical protein
MTAPITESTNPARPVEREIVGLGAESPFRRGGLTPPSQGKAVKPDTTGTPNQGD